MSYSARALADSISPDGVRLTTFELVFPRFILAELNTHRMFSRNSASSRAIPPEKLIARVMENPFVPETFNARVKGMGIGVPLQGVDAAEAEETWLTARDNAVGAAERLVQLDCDKSRINRLLEPFLWHTAIVSSTEWDNFFALRCPPGDKPDIDFPAQVEFQQLAILMRDVLGDSAPRQIGYDEWHLPLVSFEEVFEHGVEKAKLLSTSRCARVSFDKHTDIEPIVTTIGRAERLQASGHLSPFEHVARPLDAHYPSDPKDTFIGNFRGWWQFRKDIDHEDNHGALLNALTM